MAKALSAKLGIRQADYNYISLSALAVKPGPEMLSRLSVDTCGLFSGSADDYTIEINDDTFTDEWGLKYRRAPGSYQYDFVENPLKEADSHSLDSYSWPDPLNPGRFKSLKAQAVDIYENSDMAIVLNPPFAAQIRELGAWLTGYERHFMDIIANQPFIEKLNETLLSWHKKWLDKALSLVGDYVSVVAIADDLGLQSGPIFNPEHYRNLYKPYHLDLINFIKQRTTAKVFFHSCGSVDAFIPDLIEIGVDILNPVQISAAKMEPEQLKEKYGRQIIFWGAACDSQKTLPFGTQDEVRRQVRRNVEALKKGGGFVFAPIHNILPDVEAGKVLTLYDEALDAGSYS